MNILIEAESYIGGTNGVEYFDTSAGNGGNANQFADDVDVQITDDVAGDYHLTKIKPGEYLTYQIDIANSGEYNLVARIASGLNNRKVEITLGGQTYNLDFDSTGGAWADVILPSIFLDAGSQELRVDVVKGAFELNYFELQPVGGISPDTDAPTASLNASDIMTAGGTDYSFTVSYNDATGLDEATIDTNDITVIGPNGALPVTSVVNNADGTVTYTISAPGGSWDEADDGSYTVTLQAGEVADVLGNIVPELLLGTFAVNIANPPPPSPNLRIEAESYIGGTNGVEYFDTSAGNGGNANQFADDVDVQITDDVAGDYHLTKIKPGEYLTYQIDIANSGEYNLVARIASGLNNRKVEITLGGQTYNLDFDSTGGAWADVILPSIFLDAGSQELRVDVVKGAFELNYFELQPVGGISPDTDAPTASLNASDIMTAGGTDYSFTVSYNDATGLDEATIDTNDITVIGPNGALPVTSVVNNADGTVTYTISAPGGSWDEADDGSYTVTLQAGEVADVLGNIVPELLLGTFAVNIANPPPPSPNLRIEAESYIGGTNGVEYFDTSAGNGGNANQFADDVDVQITDDVAGDYHLTKIKPGEYLTYQIDIANSGEYNLVARIASGLNNRKVEITLGGQTYNLDFDSTGGAWADVILPSIFLDAGSQELRVDVVKGAFELNYFELQPVIIGSSPIAEEIPDIVVLEDASDSNIDLFNVFDDAQDSDSDLAFVVLDNSNPNLVSTSLAGGTLTLDYSAVGTGEANITIRATDTDSNPTETTFTTTVVTPQANDGVIRINAGGDAVYNDLGHLFQADTYNAGGQAVSILSTQAIANTKSDTLYQTQRQGGNFTYSIPVANGNYFVNAHLVEWEATDYNQRLFDITVEGQTYYEDLDVYGEIKNAFLAGENTAKVIQGPDKNTSIIATVDDGTLDINFTANLGEATIAALEIVPVGPGWLVRETNGNTQVTEGATVDSYTIALTTQPTSDVVVTLQFDSSQLSTNVTSLTFSPSNWNQAQTVTVTPVDDALAEGLHTSTIAHTISSSDPDYSSGLPVNNVTVAITDNDGTGGSISFTQQLIAEPIKPTSAAFGPDGRLYVASVTGNITVYTLNDDYTVATTEVIDVISNLSNSNITGIAFNPYETTPKIYISHNEFYANGGDAFAATEFSPYSGQVSILEEVNGNWELTPLVTGIGVSNHDHGVNGLEFDNNGDLFITSGSNTNAGVADPTIGGIDESPFTAAILKAEITKPDFNGNIEYSLISENDLIQPVPQAFLDSLPPEIFNPPSNLGFDPADSQFWGGYVDVVPGVDVSVYASGLRNPYDLVFTTQGLLYATENNANGGFGAESTGAYTDVPFGQEQPEELNLIQEGAYYGHPNRNRGRADARQNVYYDSPVDLPTEGYTAPIGTFLGSTNGITEYRATTFGGQLRGNLLAQKWKNNLYNIELSSDGTQVLDSINLNDVATVTGGTTNGRVAQGLDIITGPGGAIVGVDYTRDELTIAIPDEFGVTGPTAYDIYPWRAPVTGGQAFIIGGVNFDTDPGDTRVFVGDQEIFNLGVSEERITGILPNLSNQVGGLLDVTIRDANDNIVSVISEAFQPLA
ncbi:carbohydrate-binding domain-containing protein [Acaryochloris marina]|uniref:carbohydrate-binding domain-containing protein n=1 Tax=Acaryochloris marina TaxID=155978 RepID=UPI001BB01A98|nr:carbohydrate-binding domain-containing protein [Acaryochloris marina]QUY44821.1 carbohydrate-binding protein [Acaryochloris marina S15]